MNRIVKGRVCGQGSSRLLAHCPVCSPSTGNDCSDVTGVFSRFENTVERQVYWPRFDSCRLGRRKVASAESMPVAVASAVPAGSSSTTCTVALSPGGTDTSQTAV